MISVFGSDIGAGEVAAAEEVLQSQWLGFGSKVETFEKEFSLYRRVTESVMVDSGSNALFLALKLLDLPVGSEVIIPSFTWVSCAQAVIMAGCKPVFCDVALETMNVTADTIEERISKNTSAIMVVHYAGLPVDMDPILRLGYPVIEDAAHAVSSDYKGQACGSIGDVGIFSFDAVKNLAVGEGGALIARSKAHVDRARKLRYCGIGKSGFEAAASGGAKANRWWEYQIDEAFIKMLPTNIAGAIGSVQLARLPALQARRKHIWDSYHSSFQGIEAIHLPVDAQGSSTHSYFTYCIRVPRRDELARYLLDRGVYTTLRYHPLHLNALYGQTEITLPNSEELNECALSIPLHPRLTDADINMIANSIRDFYL